MANKQEDDFDYEDEHIELESDKHEYGTDEGQDTDETSTKPVPKTEDGQSGSKPEKLSEHPVSELEGTSDLSNSEDDVDLLEGIEVETESPSRGGTSTKKRSAPLKSEASSKAIAKRKARPAKKATGSKKAAEVRDASRTATKKKVSTKAAPKKAAVTKAPAKKQPAKKVPGKKAPAKKAVAKKAATKKAVAKKAASKTTAKRRR